MVTLTFQRQIISCGFIHRSKCGASIDCHQCASKDGPGCTDEYDVIEGEGNIDSCDDKDTHCLKIKIIAKLADSGTAFGEDRRSIVTTRGCIREDGARDYCKAIMSSQGVMFKCICSGDGCNGGPSLGASLGLLLLTVLAVLGVRKLL